PALAETWESDETGTVWTFHLRDGATFPDGTPVDAEAVKLSFDRTIAINRGPATFIESVVDVQAVDSLTVAITLEEADPYIVNKVTKIGIVNPSAVEANATESDPWAEEW